MDPQKDGPYMDTNAAVYKFFAAMVVATRSGAAALTFGIGTVLIASFFTTLGDGTRDIRPEILLYFAISCAILYATHWFASRFPPAPTPEEEEKIRIKGRRE